MEKRVFLMLDERWQTDGVFSFVDDPFKEDPFGKADVGGAAQSI